MDSMRFAAELPQETYDVVVAGGGLSGVCAAVAAARGGARTLLLEATGALGGMATMGLVPNWCGQHDQIRIIHSGLCQKILFSSTPGAACYDFVRLIPCIDAERLKRSCDDMVLGSGAELLLHSRIASVVAKDGVVSSVIVANKAGLSAVSARVFIDCTGDGDLAAWAGASYEKGDEGGDMQPVTHCFLMSNVNMSATSEMLPGDWQEQILNDQRFDLIQDNFFNLGSNPAGDVTQHNSGHLWGIDATDPHSLTRGMVQGRKLAHQLHEAYRIYCHARCHNSWLAATAPLLGVRESRRILGDYVLTADDHVQRTRFADEIAFNSFFLDSHPSRKLRQLEKEGKFDWSAEMQKSFYGAGEFHGIPYRCLTPKGLRNVLVAGRSVSSDRAMQGAIRVMPVCMSMGEAAGIAAALAAGQPSVDVHQVDAQEIRRELREAGAYLPNPEPAGQMA